MLDGGEDPIYILRRLTRAAVEDIGLAEPGALAQAIAAWETYRASSPSRSSSSISPRRRNRTPPIAHSAPPSARRARPVR
jgi:hypothetical protein